MTITLLEQKNGGCDTLLVNATTLDVLKARRRFDRSRRSVSSTTGTETGGTRGTSCACCGIYTVSYGVSNSRPGANNVCVTASAKPSKFCALCGLPNEEVPCATKPVPNPFLLVPPHLLTASHPGKLPIGCPTPTTWRQADFPRPASRGRTFRHFQSANCGDRSGRASGFSTLLAEQCVDAYHRQSQEKKENDLTKE